MEFHPGERVEVDSNLSFGEKRFTASIVARDFERWIVLPDKQEGFGFNGFAPLSVNADRIHRIEEKMEYPAIPVEKLFEAVNNCPGANSTQRTQFLQNVINNANGQNPIPAHAIINAVHNWASGCDDKKQDFLDGLGLKKEEVVRVIIEVPVHRSNPDWNNEDWERVLLSNARLETWQNDILGLKVIGHEKVKK